MPAAPLPESMNMQIDSCIFCGLNTTMYQSSASAVLNFQYVFYGILVFQMLVIIFQAFTQRRREYAYYLLYIVCVAGYNMSMYDGLWENDRLKVLRLLLDHPFVGLIFFFYFRFARHFLEIPVLYPDFNSRVIWFERSLFFLVGMSVLGILSFGDTMVEESVFSFIAFSVTMVSVYFIGNFLKIKETRLKSFMLAGAVFILLGASFTFIFFKLNQWELLSVKLPPTIPHQLCTIAELIIFTTALSLKSYLLEREKRETEQQLIAELQAKERLFKEVDQLRNRISGDLHDDIGATLSSIDVYAATGIKAMNKGDYGAASDYLSKIAEISKEALNEMRRMLWVLQPGKDSLRDLLNRWEDFAKPLLATRNIRVQTMLEESALGLKLNVAEKKNLYLILKEAAHNVYKHASGNAMQLSLRKVDGGILIHMVNEWEGVNRAEGERGKGLDSIRERANEINCKVVFNCSQTKIFDLRLFMPLKPNV